MLKMEYFYYMREVYETGSINHAAERLYLSQPYLSQTLKRMEQQLGVRLFHRTNRGVSLTDAGMEFLEISRQVIELDRKAENLRKRYDQEEHMLNISSMPSFTMMNLYQRYVDDNPQMSKSNFTEMPNSQVPDEIYRGGSNIGLYFMNSERYEECLREFRAKNLNFTPLVEEPLYAVLNTKSPLARLDRVSLQQLKELDYLAEYIKLPEKKKPVENNPFPKLFHQKQDGPVFNNNRSMLFYLTMSEKRYAVGQKSLNISNPFVQMGQLTYVPITDIHTRFITGYLTSELKESSRQEEQFISFLEDFYDRYREEMPACEKNGDL